MTNWKFEVQVRGRVDLYTNSEAEADRWVAVYARLSGAELWARDDDGQPTKRVKVYEPEVMRVSRR